LGLDGDQTKEAISFDSYLTRFNSAVGLSATGDQIGFTNIYDDLTDISEAKPDFDFGIELKGHTPIQRQILVWRLMAFSWTICRFGTQRC
jgi:hypothetical protein